MTRRLVDATLLNDELDLLLLRMQRLSGDVEHFYVAESAESYTGIAKPMHLSENLRQFDEFADRMTVIVYGGSNQHVGWKREEIARDSLRQAVSGLPSDTVVYFSDLDELPSRAQVAAMREIREPHAVPLDTFYRRANWRLEGESPILVAKATPVAKLPSDFTKFRWPDHLYPELLRGAGWPLQLPRLRCRSPCGEGRRLQPLRVPLRHGGVTPVARGRRPPRP